METEICQCGHPKKDHSFDYDGVFVDDDGGVCFHSLCQCQTFRNAEESMKKNASMLLDKANRISEKKQQELPHKEYENCLNIINIAINRGETNTYIWQNVSEECKKRLLEDGFHMYDCGVFYRKGFILSVKPMRRVFGIFGFKWVDA
jgi:hypothetical protein